MMRLTILVLAMLAVASCLVDVKDRIVGRVIHIETLRQRGKWAWITTQHDGSSYKYYINWHGIPLDEVFYDCENQYLVHVTDDGYVMLESVCDPYRNRFLGAGYPDGSSRQTVLLTKVDYMPDAIAQQWTVKCEDESMEVCQFLPRRWPDRRMTNTWQDGYKSDGDYWCTIGGFDWDFYTFRIYAPDPSDQMLEIFSLDNCQSTTTASYKRDVTVGVSQTKASSHTVTKSTSIEVGGAFNSFSASSTSSISSSWTEESSTTYEASIKKTIMINIGAGQNVKLYQLTGYYAGDFAVGSETYQTVDQGCPSGDSKSRAGRVTYHKKTTTIDMTK